MVLAIDIGNSDIVLGGYENDTLRFTSRCGTDRRKTADEYALLFKGILELYNVSPRQIKGGGFGGALPAHHRPAGYGAAHPRHLLDPGGRAQDRSEHPSGLAHRAGQRLGSRCGGGSGSVSKTGHHHGLGHSHSSAGGGRKRGLFGRYAPPRSAHLSGGSVRLGRSAALHYAERAGTAHRSEHRGVYAGGRSVRLCGHAGRAHRPAGGRAGGTSHGSHHRRVRPPHRPLLPAAGGGG